MRAVHELVGRVREKFSDPRRKELAGLVSTFRGQIENLLGESDIRRFDLEREQTRQLNESWQTSVKIKIIREDDDLRVDARDDFSGEAIRLEGNEPRFLEIAGFTDHRYWEKPKPGGDFGKKIFWMQEWIGYTTFLEKHREELLAASPAPVAP